MKNPIADKIVSISAMITAVIAVVIAVVELQTTREFQRLSVEPYLEVSYSNANVYESLLINTGLGPARIKTVDVNVDGSKVSNWGEAVEKLTEDTDTPIRYGALWNGRRIRAEEQVVLLHLTENETALKFQKNISKINIEICYCSVYDDCWIKEGFKSPVPVKKCPATGRQSFPLK